MQDHCTDQLYISTTRYYLLLDIHPDLTFDKLSRLALLVCQVASSSNFLPDTGPPRAYTQEQRRFCLKFKKHKLLFVCERFLNLGFLAENGQIPKGVGSTRAGDWRLMLISAGESDWLCWCRLGCLYLHSAAGIQTTTTSQP